MSAPRTPARATRRNVSAFLRDEERGSATLWNLFWLTGFGVLLGLGIDTSAAMNVKARLQTVADAAAHAAVIDIFPVADDAIDTAVAFALQNEDDHEDVVTDTDVMLGYWNGETRTFETGDVPYLNAVQVVATRDGSRANALATTFLRLAGFDNWDINAVATAIYHDDMSLIHSCRTNGYVAGGETAVTANNVLIGELCMHGEGSLRIASNNIITCGSQLSTPSAEQWKSGQPPSGNPPEECRTDYLEMSDAEMLEQAAVYGSLPNTAELEYENVKKMLDAFIANEEINDPFHVIPPYITRVENIDPNRFRNDSRDGRLVPGTLYVISCGGAGQNLQPEGIIQNVGIYTDCEVNVAKDRHVSNVKPVRTTGNITNDQICDPDELACEEVPWAAELAYDFTCADAVAEGFETYQTMLDTAPGETYRDGVTVDTDEELCGIEPGANGLWDNVFLFTTANADGDRTHKSVTFPNNMQIGRVDGCTEGGGVRIYSGGSVETPSGTMIHGSHFVVLGDVRLAAKASGTQGVTVNAAGNIQFAAQGRLGGCRGEEEYLESDVVITVRPIAIVY